MTSPNLPLVERVAVVTGAGRGLGRAMSIALANAGASVIAVDRDKETVDDLASRAGGQVIPAGADVSIQEDMEGIVNLSLARFGRVDVVVSNAAMGLISIRKTYHSDPIRFWEVEPETLRRFLDVNTVAFFRLGRLVAPLMIEQGWGRIVSVTTSLSTMIRSGMFPYGASKAGNEAIASAMAGDLRGTGVTVNVLVPGGAADTGFVPDDKGVDRSKLVPPDVMGPPMVWLASTESDGVTARRFIAKEWDVSLPGSEAARLCSAPIAWGKDDQE
ncbi:MAG: SDR family oxidoreductase [Actinomycetota bacterium]|nr:MAG: SDR family oxidoreductase [Actinomycetota bacterium]